MNQKTKGILCILASAFCFAVMNTFVRLSGDLPSIQKAFFRNLVAIFFAVAVLRKNQIKIGWPKGSGKIFLLRSFFGTMGIICNFYAVDHLVLSDASMLNKMSPFFVILFSFLILKERLSLVQGLSVVTAFAGSLFIIKPVFSNMELVPSMIGLCGGLGAGIAYTMVRILGKKGVKGPVIVFFFSTFSCVVTLPYLIVDYAYMKPIQIFYLICAGLAASGGQFGITAAYCYAPAKEISVYDYSQIIFAAVIGFFVFGQKPDFLSVIGYIIICGTAVAMFLYNNRKTEVIS